jgi:hypothetical protein
VAVKPPVVAPAATVTLAGTVMLALLLDRPTLAPPVGAAALSVTVQEDVPGETTLDGPHVTPLTITDGVAPSAKVLDPPPKLAVRVTV